MRYIILFLFLSAGQSVFSQELLTPEEAIRVTIENNFGIRITRKSREIAVNNATKAAVGFNPVVNFSSGGNFNLGSSRQNFFNGNENKVDNAVSLSGNAAVTGNYTIYDETRNVTLDQLKEVLNLSDLQLRQTIELNILQLINRYYEVARLTSVLNVLDQTIELSNNRLQRVQYQYEYGQGLRLDILNAQVDIQRDSINYFNTRQLLSNAKRDLNVIMGMPLDNSFEVDTTVLYRQLNLTNLAAQMKNDNIELKLLEKNIHITRYDLEVLESEKKPRLGAIGSYTFNQQKNPSGAFITSSNSFGLNLGLNISWNLYDGGLRHIRRQNTEVNLANLDLQRQGLELELERDLANAWESYENALFVLRSEEVNLETSRLNFERTEERFNLGQSNSVEFRQAQLNLLNAATNYNNARYTAKVIESSLLQLAGSLLEGN